MKALDPVLCEVIRGRLVAATEDMANTLIRTAYSPIIYDVRDMCATIMSAQGDMWAETPGVIVFSQGFPDAVKSGIRHWRGEFSPGDVLIVNDPFETGTHLSDTNVYVPAFWEQELVAFCGIAAHWADIGGKNAGGWCPDTTDMFQEGLCFRHQKLVQADIRNEGLWSLILDNVRVPEFVAGDLEAQIAACRYGATRIEELCSKYGTETVRGSMSYVLDATDRAMREQVAKLPSGTYSSSIRLDGDGISPESDVLVSLTTTVKDGTIRFSMEGSSPAARGPVNLPAICTKGTIASAVKGLLMPFDPCNAGHVRCLEFQLPEASVVNPSRPAPTDSYGYTVVCVMELVFRSLASVLPEGCPAGGYMLTGAFLSRTQSDCGRPFVMMESLHGGNGAAFGLDGPTNQMVANGDLPNTPVEVTEIRFPVHIDRLEYAPEMSGAGKFRGGKGVRKDYRLLEPECFVALTIQCTRDVPSKGLFGGQDGKPGYFVIDPGTEHERSYNRAVASIGPLAPQTVIRVVTGGGGGWGPPRERDPQRVLSDVDDGFLSPKDAHDIYGVQADSETSISRR